MTSSSDGSAAPPAPDAPRLSRREARTRALEVLFAADVRDALPSAVLDAEPHVDAFTRQLVDVVIANRAAVDALIAEHAQGWALDRMPAVDRSVLRLGAAEMLFVEEVPPKVAVDEAVELAKSLSTDASPKFVNGVLAAIARANDLF